MSRWQIMETDPKDAMILLDVGLPYAVVGTYNKVNDQFVYADMQIGMYQGEYGDTYFENKYERKPKRWMPLPELPKV